MLQDPKDIPEERDLGTIYIPPDQVTEEIIEETRKRLKDQSKKKNRRNGGSIEL